MSRFAASACLVLSTLLVTGALPAGAAGAAAPAAASAPAATLLLVPDRVFDGESMHAGWAVLVEGERIAAAGKREDVVPPAGTEVLELPGTTLLPGMIEGHSHLFLHPYDETAWDDQVLREPRALRVARAVAHARATLEAGFTTARDLGTEGAGYADAGLRDAIAQGIVPGPRLLVATRAIVATGSYGPSGFDPAFDVPLGAEPADGDDLRRVVRDQIGKGADWVKVYADYRWGPRRETRPTFSLAELETLVATAADAGRPVSAHAASPEGMRRATLAGVTTIEHGDGGTPEVFALMAERGVALCPTLAAAEAVTRYSGWRPGEPEPERLRLKRAAFRAALDAGVTVCFGGDSGVFPHGENVREAELMVDYGMMPLAVLTAATSVNARLFGFAGELGTIEPRALADLVAVDGDPAQEISALRRVRLVLQSGRTVFAR